MGFVRPVQCPGPTGATGTTSGGFYSIDVNLVEYGPEYSEYVATCDKANLTTGTCTCPTGYMSRLIFDQTAGGVEGGLYFCH
jgi:hypothetical protein